MRRTPSSGIAAESAAPNHQTNTNMPNDTNNTAGSDCPVATCSPSSLEWRVHTPNMLKEIGNNNDALSATMRVPLMILGDLLHKVGTEAARINDPALNSLMCRLTIYSCADPESPDYDQELLERILSPEND